MTNQVASRVRGPVTQDRPCWRPLESRLGKSATVRWDLVDRVRSEIAAGNYETPEKLAAAIDRLADSLFV